MTGPDDDAALVALVEELDHADDELRGRLARELDARGGLEAAGRLASSQDDGARRAAARIAHLLPDERHVATLVPLVSDPDQRYRVLAFYGCSTNAYDAALRSTGGFGTKEADLLLTNRVTRGGADVAAFMAFLDGFVNQGSAEKLLGSMNTAMAKHENRFAGNPWEFTGLRDNPGR